MKKRSNVKILFLVGIVCGVLLMGSYVFNQDQEVILEETDTVSSDMVSIYIESDGEYTQDTKIPTSGYTFNEKDSYCTVGGEIDKSITISYDSATQSLSVSPMTTQGTKCYLYFEEVESAGDTILGNITVNEGSPTLTGTSCATGTNNGSNCDVSENGVYEGTDDDGTTYYFRGTVDNNWVSFAGYYWRIIRINGDGTIRLIYSGSDATGPAETGTNTQIQTSAFNSSSRGSYYVGYMYTANEQRGNTASSTIKGILDSWYQTNLSSYSSYLVDSGFCGDREMRNGYTWEASPSSSIYYAAQGRKSGTPTFKCSNSADLYTVSNSKGNQALSNPIGLITLDEVRYAGGYGDTSNYGYWLYTGQEYWTMSPSYASSGGYAGVNYVRSSGGLNGYSVNSGYGVRPVINLRSDVTISSGDGSSENPYTI